MLTMTVNTVATTRNYSTKINLINKTDERKVKKADMNNYTFTSSATNKASTAE